MYQEDFGYYAQQVQPESNQLVLSKINWKLTITLVVVSLILFLLWWHDQKNDGHHKDLKISLKKMRDLID